MLSFLRTAAAVGRSMMPSADQSFSKSGMTDAFRKKIVMPLLASIPELRAENMRRERVFSF